MEVHEEAILGKLFKLGGHHDKYKYSVSSYNTIFFFLHPYIFLNTQIALEGGSRIGHVL